MLIALRDACPLLACRDVRTARRRLAALGVPVVTLGRRVLVDGDSLSLAIRSAVRPESREDVRRGVVLAPGARCWDDGP